MTADDDCIMIGAVSPTAPERLLPSAETLFICGHAVAPERLEIGYAHCSRPACVVLWRRHRIAQERLALVLVPKQGFTWVTGSDASQSGRSSGR